MTYYKVPKQLDQYRLYTRDNCGRKCYNGYSLIENELLTEKECIRINAPIEKLTRVEYKKTECYRMFGARFFMED